jgi:NAD(P)-dependent dehydrogenase (short-subunit alcohol dehydrogenase family)
MQPTESSTDDFMDRSKVIDSFDPLDLVATISRFERQPIEELNDRSKFFFEDELQQHGSNLPWGRLAKPEDIAHGAVFLCDPRSDYITGATLSIDGGIVLPYQEMFRIRNRPKA